MLAQLDLAAKLRKPGHTLSKKLDEELPVFTLSDWGQSFPG